MSDPLSRDSSCDAVISIVTALLRPAAAAVCGDDNERVVISFTGILLRLRIVPCEDLQRSWREHADGPAAQ